MAEAQSARRPRGNERKPPLPLPGLRPNAITLWPGFIMTEHVDTSSSGLTDSTAAWLRLGVAVLLSTVGGVGMWSFMVALPAIQADFGVGRGEASLPFTLAMIGFACGGVLMGKLADRFGIAMPLALGTALLVVGYLAVGLSSSLW